MKKIKLNLDQIEADLELNTPEENMSIKGGYDWSAFWNSWSNMQTGTYIPNGSGGFDFYNTIMLQTVNVYGGYGYGGYGVSGGYGGYGVNGGYGASAIDIFGLGVTAYGTAATWADVAANAAQVSSTGFSLASRIFAGLDIASNFYEFRPGGGGSAEDVLQILMAGGLLFASGPVAIVGGVALSAWELYEYMRDHNML